MFSDSGAPRSALRFCLENNVCPPKKIPAEGVTGDKNSRISNDQKKKIPAN